MTLNIDLLRQAVKWAEEESLKQTGSTWDQNVWAWGETTEQIVSASRLGSHVDEDWREVRCGTAFCVAGHIAHQAGDKFVASSHYGVGREADPEMVYVPDQNVVMDVQRRAADLLGVTYSEVNALFEAENTIEDVRHKAAMLAANYGHPL